MAALLLLLALPLGAWSQSISSCGAAGDHFKDVKMTISPDPIEKGKPFTIDVSGTLDATLTAMNADVDLTVKALGIDKAVKTSSPISISPGLAAGAQTLSVGPMTLPDLPVSASAVGTVKLTNDKKEPVACINLNLNLPAESSELAAATPEKSLSTPQGSKLGVCSAPSDHLKNLAVSTTAGVTTITGSLDEAVTKLNSNVDLTVKIGFISKKIQMAVPVTYTPGLVKGDLKITAGPSQSELSSSKDLVGIDVDITGTIKIDDGANSEIACLSLSPAMESDTPVITV